VKHWQPENFPAPPQGWADSKTGPRRTPELVARAQEMRANGRTYLQIAVALGVSRGTAMNYCKERK
jgi:DNA invertase Pin-like site-specific DNA recombinase